VLYVDDVVQISGIPVISNHRSDIASAPQRFANDLDSCAAICPHNHEHKLVSFTQD
jgi:hypothetical protein